MIPGSSQTDATCTVHEILIEKHPPGKPASTNSLLQGLPMPMNSILFENLNGDAIRKAAAGLSSKGCSRLINCDWVKKL